MRTSHLTFLIVLFFVADAIAQTPAFQPVGTIRQIMIGIVAPSSDIIFKVPNKAPKDDKEWSVVQNSALTLAEAGNLLLIPSRAKDKSEWEKNANALIMASAEAFKAANAKDAKALEDIGDKIEETCEKCHATYLPAK